MTSRVNNIQIVNVYESNGKNYLHGSIARDHETIDIAAVVIRANPGLPGLVDHEQGKYIGETRVDIAS